MTAIKRIQDGPEGWELYLVTRNGEEDVIGSGSAREVLTDLFDEMQVGDRLTIIPGPEVQS